MIVLGFDFGLARTGVALGNSITQIATPLCTLNSKDQKPDWDKITSLVQEWRPEQFVVGLPLRMDGTESDTTEKAKRFGRQLEGRYNLPVTMMNETLTSLEAEQRLKHARQSGRKKKIKKNEVDQLAAAIIVESWIQSYA